MFVSFLYYTCYLNESCNVKLIILTDPKLFIFVLIRVKLMGRVRNCQTYYKWKQREIFLMQLERQGGIQSLLRIVIFLGKTRPHNIV